MIVFVVILYEKEYLSVYLVCTEALLHMLDSPEFPCALIRKFQRIGSAEESGSAHEFKTVLLSFLVICATYFNVIF